MAESVLPLPWYLVSMSRASEDLPLAKSQCGDSGRNQMRDMTIRDGNAWRMTGIRHDQLVVRWLVP
jgi:hypothetical protein